MIPFDEMPEGNTGLARVAVRFPSFREPDGSRCYVTVRWVRMAPRTSRTTKTTTATPEQFGLGDDHEAF